MKTYAVKDAEAMRALSRGFAKHLSLPLVIWLIGNLGSGKTVFAEGFIKGLGWKKRVKSPTYTLVEVYATPKCEARHFDLYRLSGPEDLEMIGIRDYFDANGVCLFEWADRAQEILPPPDLVFQFSYIDEGRQVVAQSQSETGNLLLEQNG